MGQLEHEVPHGMILPATHDEFSREMFNRDMNMFLEATMRPQFREIYETQVKPALAQKIGREPSRREIAKAMRTLDINKLWYAARTQTQRNMYEVSSNVIERQKDDLAARAETHHGKIGSLKLNPSLPVPNYISSLDIHLLRGGYDAETGPDDITAGAIFDRNMTVNRMGTQGLLSDDPGVSLAVWLKQRFPDLKPRRILEMGCTVAHCLPPMKDVFPEAEIHGIDVAAPVLRYAHARAVALNSEIHLSQQNAESTDFELESFDVVFSRILMHETSRTAVPRIIAESHRLAKPGGVVFHSDAPLFDEFDAYTASLRDWDISCNQEPFMDTYYELPVEKMFAEAGFAPESIFRAYVPSQHVIAKGIDPKITRHGGAYFLIGAIKS